VSADVAAYERGSTGEATQGAGAVAQLFEEAPALYSLDLQHAGSAASYRGLDFRKPFRRYYMKGEDPRREVLGDYPVFNGRYTTVCYVDQMRAALQRLLDSLGLDLRALCERLGGVFMHRPYRQMPLNALAALYVWGLHDAPAYQEELSGYCERAGVDFRAVVRELASQPDLFDELRAGVAPDQVFPNAMRVARDFRSTETFRHLVQTRLQLGAERMMDLGNLYTAALPAWIAAGAEAALELGRELAGAPFLTIGYGSGDAAEAMLIHFSERWRDAAMRIGFVDALGGAIDLEPEQYAALHEGRPAPGLDRLPSGEVYIASVGQRCVAEAGQMADVGIESYRYAP